MLQNFLAQHSLLEHTSALHGCFIEQQMHVLLTSLKWAVRHLAFWAKEVVAHETPQVIKWVLGEGFILMAAF